MKQKGKMVPLLVLAMAGIATPFVGDAKTKPVVIQQINWVNHSVFNVMLKLDTISETLGSCKLKPNCVLSPANRLSASQFGISKGSIPNTTFNIYMYHDYLNLNKPPPPIQCNTMVLSPGYDYTVVISDTVAGNLPVCTIV